MGDLVMAFMLCFVTFAAAYVVTDLWGWPGIPFAAVSGYWLGAALHKLFERYHGG